MCSPYANNVPHPSACTNSPPKKGTVNKLMKYGEGPVGVENLFAPQLSVGPRMYCSHMHGSARCSSTPQSLSRPGRFCLRLVTVWLPSSELRFHTSTLLHTGPAAIVACMNILVQNLPRMFGTYSCIIFHAMRVRMLCAACIGECTNET